MAGPMGKQEIESLLRSSGYAEEWHVRRLVETALLVPPAEDGARMVDLGTHPAVLNVLAQVGGYEQVDGVDSDEARAASWTVDMPVWGSDALRTYRIHNRDL